MLTKKFSNGLVISSDFCSGNLNDATLISHSTHSSTIHCQTRGDLNADKYSTWFYFYVKVPQNAESSNQLLESASSYTINFVIRNMNGQKKLFRQGHKPVMRFGSAPSSSTLFAESVLESGSFSDTLNNSGWMRIQDKMTFEEQQSSSLGDSNSDDDDDSEDDDEEEEEDSNKRRQKQKRKHELRFRLTIPAEKRSKKCFVAYCYPWSVKDNEKMLNHFESQFSNHRRVYFHRETLVHSLEGRNVEVITVSSRRGISQQRESSLPGCYPNEEQERAFRFPQKRTYLLTARVHPGETPASHIFNGFFRFILHSTDPRAALLRNHYVFKFVPLLNPDGVSRGHYRADTQGLNLNRFYKEPTPEEHPSIFAVKALAGYLNEYNNLHMYMDLHAHATKRGCFIFGNSLPDFEEQLENVMYSKLVALNTQHLDFHAGNFSEKSMKSKDKRDGLSKDGTGRVGMYKHTGLVHCYTLEGNYNTGKSINRIGALPSLKSSSQQYDSELPTYSKQCPKYDIAIFEDVGKALCTALLDVLLGDENPYSRIKDCPLRDMEGVRKWTSKVMSRKKKFWKDASKKRQPIWERPSASTNGVSNQQTGFRSAAVAMASGGDASHQKHESSTRSLLNGSSVLKRKDASGSSSEVDNSADESDDERESAQLPSTAVDRSERKMQSKKTLSGARVISITDHTPPFKRRTDDSSNPVDNSSDKQPLRQNLLRTSVHSQSPLVKGDTSSERLNSARCSTSSISSSRGTKKKKASQRRLKGRAVVCHSVSSFERLMKPKTPKSGSSNSQSFNTNLVKFDPYFDGDYTAPNDVDSSLHQRKLPSRGSIQMKKRVAPPPRCIPDGLIYDRSDFNIHDSVPDSDSNSSSSLGLGAFDGIATHDQHPISSSDLAQRLKDKSEGHMAGNRRDKKNARRGLSGAVGSVATAGKKRRLRRKDSTKRTLNKCNKMKDGSEGTRKRRRKRRTAAR